MDEKARAIQVEAFGLRDFCEEQSKNPYNNQRGEKHVRQLFADVAARAQGIGIMVGELSDATPAELEPSQRDEVRSELTAILSVLDRIVKKVDLLYPDDLMSKSFAVDEHGGI